MSSGLMPSTTFFPSKFRRAGREAVASSATLSLNPANSTEADPLLWARFASTMFMAGDPMNPATNRLTGWSYST